MIEVSNNHPTERTDTDRLARIAERVLESEGASTSYLGVVLCSHDEHRELHERFLQRSDSTDVLAFLLETDDGGRVEGEVYIDLDTARERHAEFGDSFDHEVGRYAVHGILHLLGYDDKDTAARVFMKKKEDDYVHRFVKDNM